MFWKPIPLEDLKTRRPRHYKIVTIDLGTARTNELLWCVGDFIGVAAITGSCTMRINENNLDAINLRISRKIYTPFYRFYITNSAQAGKSVTLYIGGDASFEIDVAGKMGMINVAGTDINPATEDTLATLATQATLALIKAKTDNLDVALTALRDALILPAATPAIYNVVMTNANAEYSQALPAGTKKFSIHLRENDATYRVAFVTGKVATPTEPYETIPSSWEYYEDGVNLTGMTIYFACPSAGKHAEILAWT